MLDQLVTPVGDREARTPGGHEHAPVAIHAGLGHLSDSRRKRLAPARLATAPWVSHPTAEGAARSGDCPSSVRDGA